MGRRRTMAGRRMAKRVQARMKRVSRMRRTGNRQGSRRRRNGTSKGSMRRHTSRNMKRKRNRAAPRDDYSHGWDNFKFSQP